MTSLTSSRNDTARDIGNSLFHAGVGGVPSSLMSVIPVLLGVPSGRLPFNFHSKVVLSRFFILLLCPKYFVFVSSLNVVEVFCFVLNF